MARSIPVFIVLVILCASCGGGSPTSPTSVPTYSPTQDAATAATLTYTKDIQPILAADCTSCHNPSQRAGGYDFTAYSGVLRALTPGSAQSPLVRATQSNGQMYQQFRGSASAKSETIRRWVVNFGAAQ